MSEIRYIDANEFQIDIWKLAAIIRKSQWKPDVLVGLWRGGATVTIAVHEFLKASGCPAEHLPLKCFSYTAIGKNEGEVNFSLAEETFKLISPGKNVLFIDDIFDTGKTAAAIYDRIKDIPIDAKFASVYWKKEKNLTSIEPDFFVREMDSGWICFPHEIDGLSPQEIQAKNPTLAKLLEL